MKAFAFLLITLFSAASLFAQASDDDVYFSTKDAANEPVATVKQEEKQPAAPAAVETYDYDYSDGYYEDEDNYTNNSQTSTEGQGNTYITNNYYGDNYGTDYTTRINRYYNPYSGFGYYSPAYGGGYYDPYYGSGWSVSVNVGWGYPYYGGYSSWGYYDPWYPSYGYGCGYPYYGGGYCGGGYYGGGYYGGGYNNGYWNGYNHGYYDGYYGGGYGGGGYYDSPYSNGSYNYGPRTGGNGYSSYRKEQQTQQVATPVRTVNQMPASDKGGIQPVRQTQPQTGNVKENEIQPARSPVTNGNTYGTIDKGNVQPTRTETKPVERYDVNDKGNVQPVRSTETSPKPNTGGYTAPRTEPVERAPVEKENMAPKPTNNPNVERQAQPGKDYNQNQPQRGGVYERNDEPVQQQQQPKGNNGRYVESQDRNDAPKQNPQKYAPQQNNNTQQQQQGNSPKTYERGNQSVPRTQERSNNNYSAPAPSNKGAGAPAQRAPQGGGRMQPR